MSILYSEDHNVDIAALDIAVNAVATAVKDFFFKRLPPVLPEEQMADLETVSSKSLLFHRLFVLAV